MGLSERIMSLAGVRRNSTNVVFRIDTLGDIVLWSAGRGWQCYLTETVIFMPNIDCGVHLEARTVAG